MKSRLTIQTPAFVAFAAAITLATLTATDAFGADNKNAARPATAPVSPVLIDPSTGLPMPPWIDPNWKDPDKRMAEVSYDGLPLNEIADHLRREFKDAFDVLIPNGWQDPNNPAVSLDPGSVTIRMQLKNVTASEVFNAMNLVLEAENTPCRWELKLNGSRPTAMLRVLPQLLPVVAPAPPLPPKRMIYFVGDMIDGGKFDGMTIEKLVKTVTEVYELSYGPSKGVIQFHKDAQLIIANGTVEQVGFIQLTLAALREKAQAARRSPGFGGEPKAKTEDTKPR